MEGKSSYVNPWAWYRWVRPHPILNKPWRPEGGPENINQKLVEALRLEISDVKYDRGIRKAGVIVLGPSEAGKSSFINSSLSCMRGRIVKKTASNYSKETCTIELCNVTGKMLNFRFCDTMGFTVRNSITNGDIESILKGELKHGYPFKEGTKNKADYINEDPGVNDKIQIAVIVIDADVMKTMPSNPNEPFVKRKQLKDVLGVLKKSGILPVYILTKVDDLCAEVHKDPKMIFQSRAVHEMVKKVHDIFGPDMNDIFPVVNYVTEVETTPDRDIPLLFALRHIVSLASDHAENDSNE